MKITLKSITSLPIIIILFAVILSSLVACTEPPAAGFDADRSIAEINGPIQFTDQSTGKITEWSWNFGDGSGSNDPSPSHTYMKKGQYKVSLTVSNPAGTDETTSLISVLEPPVAHFSASQTEVMTGTEIEFEDTSTGDIENWTWDFGDGTTSTTQNPSHIYENAGVYTITLEVSNSVGLNVETMKDYIVVTNLSVSSMMFCSEVSSSGKCTVRENDCFTSGEDVWIYFEAIGFKQHKTNDGYEALINLQKVKHNDSKGTILLVTTDIEEKRITAETPPSVISFWFLVGKAKQTAQLPVYTVEVTVEDKLSGQTATRSRGYLLE
jgi:PKD repeat protein